MKRAAVAILMLLGMLSALVPLTAWQNTPTIGVLPDNGPALPATCVVGQIYFKTTTTVGLNQCLTANTWTALGTGGTGTVTNTGGSLTLNAVVLGAGGNDTKVSTGITSNGASELDVGLNGTANGAVGFNGSTSGTAKLTATATGSGIAWTAVGGTSNA